MCFVAVLLVRVCLSCTGEVPLRIVNLKPSTKYLLRVRAVNNVGAGTPVIRNEFTENIRMYVLYVCMYVLLLQQKS